MAVKRELKISNEDMAVLHPVEECNVNINERKTLRFSFFVRDFLLTKIIQATTQI